MMWVFPGGWGLCELFPIPGAGSTDGACVSWEHRVSSCQHQCVAWASRQPVQGPRAGSDSARGCRKSLASGLHAGYVLRVCILCGLLRHASSACRRGVRHGAAVRVSGTRCRTRHPQTLGQLPSAPLKWHQGQGRVLRSRSVFSSPSEMCDWQRGFNIFESASPPPYGSCPLP